MEVVTELTDLTLFSPQDPFTLKDSKRLLDLECTLRCVHACRKRLSVIQAAEGYISFNSELGYPAEIIRECL